MEPNLENSSAAAYNPFETPEQARARQEQEDLSATQKLQEKFNREYVEMKSGAFMGTDQILLNYYKEAMPLFASNAPDNLRVFYRNAQLNQPIKFDQNSEQESSGLKLRLGYLDKISHGPESIPYDQVRGKFRYMNFLPEIPAEQLYKWYEQYLNSAADQAVDGQDQRERLLNTFRNNLEYAQQKLISEYDLADSQATKQ